MKVKNIFIYLILILALVISSGCSSKNENDSDLRIGFFSNITHSQALYGKNQGIFQKEIPDKNIQWKQFSAGSAEMEALLAGEIDIAYIGPGPSINGYARSNGELQVISGASHAGAILLSRKDLKINNISELDGKKIAIPQYGNTQDLALRALLKENNLKDSSKGGTVEIYQAENSDIKTLLDNSQIDLALVPEPWGARLVKEVNANVVLDYNEVWREGKYPTAIVVARKEFLEKHPEIVEKFIKTHISITNYINENKESAKEIINNELEVLTKKPLPKDVLDNAFKRLVITTDPEKKAIEEMVDLSVKAGFLRDKPDLKDLFKTGS